MTFKINHKTYKLNIAWNTVTLKQAVQVTKCKLEEKKLEHLLNSKELVYDDETMIYIVEVLSAFSNCPAPVLVQTDNSSLVVMFDIVRYMVNQLYYLNLEEHQPLGIREITFKGKRYRMPNSLTIEDNEVLCYKEPCKNVVEASNLIKIISEMKSEGIGKMKYVCAIYLKEVDSEVYDVEKITKRADLFEELPMTVVWDVFFFTYISLNKYLTDILVPSFAKMGRLVKIKSIILGFLLLLKKAWWELLVRLRK